MAGTGKGNGRGNETDGRRTVIEKEEEKEEKERVFPASIRWMMAQMHWVCQGSYIELSLQN